VVRNEDLNCASASLFEYGPSGLNKANFMVVSKVTTWAEHDRDHDKIVYVARLKASQQPQADSRDKTLTKNYLYGSQRSGTHE
jgi:hypothetical protein